MSIAKVSLAVLLAGVAALCVPTAYGEESALSPGAPASAQEAARPPATTSDAPELIDELVVTARKRSESIQQTPLAVSAVGGADLQERQITDIASLAPSLPNMNFGSNVGFARIAIRGLGLDATVAGQEARVAYHTDGIYISRPSAQLSTFFDINRVEVLRGPQGTLYGRNATAGAVNVITNDPEQTFGGYGRVTLGNYNLTAAEGAITGPLSDTVSARLAFTKTDRDGFGKNLVTGQDIDNEHSLGVRAKVKIEPSSAVSLVLSADYSKADDADFVYHFLGQGGGNPPRVDALVAALGGTGPSPPDPRDTYANVPQSDHREFYGFAANTTASLGAVNVTSVTAYRSSYADLRGDHDGTQAAVSIIRTLEKANQWSEELRLDGNVGRLRWLAGGFYFDEDGYGEADFSPVLAFNTLFQSRGLLFNGKFKTRASAVFGQVDFEATEALTLTAGLRYSRETKSIDQRGQIDLATVATPGFTPNFTLFQNQSATFSSPTPHLNIEYKFSPRITAYATYSKGFKSGGFNLTGFTPPVTPEKLTNYETGLKSDWLDGKLRFNASAFYYDYKDLQVQKIVNAAAILVNAATARVKGVETELVIRPVSRLEIFGNASYLDAKFTSFSTADAARPALGVLNLTGNTLPQAPRVTANAAVQYTFDVRSGELVLRGELAYTSQVFFSPFNREAISQAAFSKGNALLTYSRTNGLTASLWVRNVSDKRTISTSQVSSGFLGFPIMGTFDPPRTYGGSIGYRF
jgi:iron complex outermembrane receptor protein